MATMMRRPFNVVDSWFWHKETGTKNLNSCQETRWVSKFKVHNWLHTIWGWKFTRWMKFFITSLNHFSSRHCWQKPPSHLWSHWSSFAVSSSGLANSSSLQASPWYGPWWRLIWCRESGGSSRIYWQSPSGTSVYFWYISQVFYWL